MISTLDVLKDLFVYVPSGKVASFKAAHVGDAIEQTDNYYFRVAFLGESGEIATHGRIYGTNTSSDLAAIQAALNGFLDEGASTVATVIKNITDLVGATGFGENEDTSKTILSRIQAIEDLIGAAGDADNTINKLQEVLDWFNGVDEQGENAYTVTVNGEEVELGKGQAGLLTTVAEAKNAIGVESKPNTAGEGEPSNAVEATGIYKRIEDLEAVNDNRDLTTEDTAVEGQYVSSVSQNADGTIVVTREDLPELSVKSGSDNYVGVDNHEVEIKTTALGAVNLVKGEDGKWSAPEEVTTSTGLATAADVATEMVANEQVVAAALNEIVAVLSWEEYA